MSKSQYTIRGFNAFQEGGDSVQSAKFNSFGVMEQFGTYVEKTVPSQADAIVELLRSPSICTFSARNLAAMPNTFGGVALTGLPNVTDVRDAAKQAEPVDEIVVLDIQADFDTADIATVRGFRDDVVETFKRWSEKSRVRGTRGWRVSAVKSPRFEKNDDGKYTLRTQVILGTSVFYDQDTVKIGVDVTATHRDIANLKHFLGKATGSTLRQLRVNHSTLGKIVL